MWRGPPGLQSRESSRLFLVAYGKRRTNERNGSSSCHPPFWSSIDRGRGGIRYTPIQPRPIHHGGNRGTYRFQAATHLPSSRSSPHSRGIPSKSASDEHRDRTSRSSSIASESRHRERSAADLPQCLACGIRRMISATAAFPNPTTAAQPTPRHPLLAVEAGAEFADPRDQPSALRRDA